MKKIHVTVKKYKFLTAEKLIEAIKNRQNFAKIHKIKQLNIRETL